MEKNYISHTMEISSEGKQRDFEKALNFDGVNDWGESSVNLYNYVWLNKRFSISYWVNLKSSAAMVDYFMNDNQPIRSQPHSGPVPYTRLQFYSGVSDQFVYIQFVQTSNTNFVQTNIQQARFFYDINLTKNEFHHITINYDGTNWTSGQRPLVEIYVDRRLLTSLNNGLSTFQTTSTIPPIQAYNNGYYVGRFYNFLNAGGNTDVYYNFDLADHFIFNRWLTPTEVSTLYNIGSNTTGGLSKYPSSVLSSRIRNYLFNDGFYSVTSPTTSFTNLSGVSGIGNLIVNNNIPNPNLINVY